MASFISGERQIGMSDATQRWFAIDCRNAIVESFSTAVPRATRTELATKCLNGDLAITQAAPTDSFAWFAAAHASLALRDMDGVNTYLQRSHSTGAREGWIARYRVELMAANLANLDEANQEWFWQDVALMLNRLTAFGPFIAALYLDNSELRPRLTELIEQQPSEQQRAFLDAVNRVNGQRSKAADNAGN